MELLLVVVCSLLALSLVLAAAIRVLISAMNSIDGPDETAPILTEAGDLADGSPLEQPPRADEDD